MRVYNKNGTKERLFEMFENVNKIKLNESSMWSDEKHVTDWNELNDGSIEISFSDGTSDVFNYYDDLDNQGVSYDSSSNSSDGVLLYTNKNNSLSAKLKANSLTQNPDNPEWEIVDVISVEPFNTNESFDSPKEKDKKYLDKTVGDDSSQVSKYDDGTRYPVEDKLKVKDPSLEKLKGDDAPITEDEMGDEHPLSDIMDSGEQESEEDNEEKPAWDENFGGDDVDALPADDAEEEAPELANEIGDGEIAMDAGFEDSIEGGLADEALPSDFDPAQIAKGIQVEMEHTDDPHKALEIAMDHLTEIPDYYDRLESMEAEAKGESGENIENTGEAPEDTLLDPSKHWVDDYSPSNVTDEGINYPHPSADPEAGEEEYEEMENLKNS